MKTPENHIEPRKVAIFAPYAFIDRHARLEWLVANSLPNSTEVIMVRCNRSFLEDCNAMHIAGISHDSSPEAKYEICSKCITRKKAWDKKSNYEVVNLQDSDFLTNFFKIESEYKDANLGFIDPAKFSYKGMPFGVYAAYDLLLGNKSPNGKLQAKHYGAFIYRLNATISIYEYFLKLFAFRQIEGLYVYDAQYSFNRAVVRAAADLGLKIVEFSRSIFDSSHEVAISMRTVRGEIQDVEFPGSCWPEKKSAPLSKADLRLTEKYVDEKFEPKSLWTYSHGSHKVVPELQNFLKNNIDKSHRLLIPLSSCDEQTAGFMNKGFVNEAGESIDRMKLQEEWLNSLIQQLEMQPDSDFCAIIRIHPRMFSDNRTKVFSQYLSELKEKLSTLRGSFYIDLPDQRNGIMPLIGFATAILTQTSSVGLDSILFGRKIISFGSIASGSWPRECEIRLDNIASLRDSLELSPSPDEKDFRFRHAVKWLNLAFYDPFISVKQGSFTSKSEIQKKNLKLVSRLKPLVGFKMVEKMVFKSRSNLWVRRQKNELSPSKELTMSTQQILSGIVNSTLEQVIREQKRLLDSNEDLKASESDAKKLRMDLEKRIELVLQLALKG